MKTIVQVSLTPEQRNELHMVTKILGTQMATFMRQVTMERIAEMRRQKILPAHVPASPIATTSSQAKPAPKSGRWMTPEQEKAEGLIWNEEDQMYYM